MYKYLQRCTLAVLVSASSPFAHSATLTVTTLTDTTDSTDAVLSLREAISQSLSGDSIVFDNALHGGTLVLTDGQLTIDKALSILGPGPDLMTIDGNNLDRVFHVDVNADVEISGLSITGGNEAPGGSAIRHDGGYLYVSNCRLHGNTSGFAGAGIALFFGSSLRVENCVIENNTAGIGSGLFFNGGSVTIIDTTIRNNTGIGVWNLSANATFEYSTISDNSDASFTGGAGLYNSSGTTNLVNSTVSGNRSTSQGPGGGIHVAGGVVELSNTTVADNTAVVSGGGIQVSNVGNLVYRNTLIAGNAAANGADCSFSGGSLASAGYNLTGLSTGCPDSEPSDITVDPGDVFQTLLETLGDYTGPTFTHALLPGSQAIDAGDPSGCLDHLAAPVLTDQRNIPRNARCDIGAYEFDFARCDNQAVTILGTPGDETIVGTSGDDVIHGLAGVDVIRGLGGNDIICGGAGNDDIRGWAGEDRLFGQLGDDTLRGGSDNDVLIGDEGEDTLRGGVGDDSLHGGQNNDFLSGGGGMDELHGDEGDDTLQGGNDTDTLHGGPGVDILRGGNMKDFLFGDGGNDKLHGQEGDDELNGGSGTDVCVGATPASEAVDIDLAIACETVRNIP